LQNVSAVCEGRQAEAVLLCSKGVAGSHWRKELSEL